MLVNRTVAPPPRHAGDFAERTDAAMLYSSPRRRTRVPPVEWAGLRQTPGHRRVPTGRVVTAGELVASTMASMIVSQLRVIGELGTTTGLGLLVDTLVVWSFMTPRSPRRSGTGSGGQSTPSV